MNTNNARSYGWKSYNNEYTKPAPQSVKQINPESGLTVNYYYSKNEASRAMGVTPASINTAIRNKTKVKGWYWENAPEANNKWKRVLVMNEDLLTAETLIINSSNDIKKL